MCVSESRRHFYRCHLHPLAITLCQCPCPHGFLSPEGRDLMKTFVAECSKTFHPLNVVWLWGLCICSHLLEEEASLMAAEQDMEDMISNELALTWESSYPSQESGSDTDGVQLHPGGHHPMVQRGTTAIPCRLPEKLRHHCSLVPWWVMRPSLLADSVCSRRTNRRSFSFLLHLCRTNRVLHFIFMKCFLSSFERAAFLCFLRKQ